MTLSNNLCNNFFVAIGGKTAFKMLIKLTLFSGASRYVWIMQRVSDENENLHLNLNFQTKYLSIGGGEKFVNTKFYDALYGYGQAKLGLTHLN
jgi:hypothetical protein